MTEMSIDRSAKLRTTRWAGSRRTSSRTPYLIAFSIGEETRCKWGRQNMAPTASRLWNLHWGGSNWKGHQNESRQQHQHNFHIRRMLSLNLISWSRKGVRTSVIWVEIYNTGWVDAFWMAHKVKRSLIRTTAPYFTDNLYVTDIRSPQCSLANNSCLYT
jgi:hypothetical protein